MVETLNNLARIWFDWQWAMLWQSAILISLVVLLDRLIRKWAWPQLRYALWLLVLVKLVLPPSLTSPVSVVRHLPEVAGGKWLVVSEQGQALPLEQTVVLESTLLQNEGGSVRQLTTTGEATGLPMVAPHQSMPLTGSSTVTATPVSHKVYLFLIWLVGVIGLGMGLFVRLKGLYTEHVRSSIGEAPQWFVELVTKTAQEIGCRQVPTVVLSTRVCCPAVFGLLRPVLLVPADRIHTMSHQDARHILLHELAHIKRGDLWWHGVHMLLLVLYWYHPLVWLVRRHIQNLRELCCDATVARHLRTQTSAYRETLLETARDLLAQPVEPGLGLLGLFENSHWLTTRLQWLERRTWRYPKLRIMSVALLVTAMSACILPMAQAKLPEFTVTGRITDAETGAPIPGVRVGDANEYAGGQFNTATDADGRYRYKTWYEEHSVVAQAPGFSPQEQTLLTKWIGNEKQKVIDFKLKPRVKTEDISRIAHKKAVPTQKSKIDSTNINVGIRDYLAEENKWRRFDGTLLSGKTCESFNAGLENGGVRDFFSSQSDLDKCQAKVFAFHLRGNNLDDLHCEMSIDSVRGLNRFSWCHDVGDAHQKICYFAYELPLHVDKIRLSLGIAGGPWTTVARSDGRKVVETVDTLINQPVKFMKPVKLGNRVQIYIKHGMSSDYHCRLIVRDRKGIGHIGEQLVRNSRVFHRYFIAVADVDIDNVHSFELQVRPHTVTDYKDVMLQPVSELKLKPLTERGVTDDSESEGYMGNQFEVTGPEKDTIQAILLKWFKACHEKDIATLRVIWAEDKQHFAKRDVGEMSELLNMNPTWLFSILAMAWDTTSAMVVSHPLPQGDPKVPGPMSIVWFLEKKREQWKLVDIDLEDISGLQVENSRFMKRHPNAEIWLDDPDDRIKDRVQSRQLIDNPLVITRDDVNELLRSGIEEDKKFYRKHLSDLAKHWLFSRRAYFGDTLCEMYTVQAGDTLSKIGDKYKLPYEFLMMLNRIGQANQLQVGQELKVVHGPFNIQVHRSENRMDLYLQEMYVQSYEVRLGRPGNATPTGLWQIPANAKLIAPVWTDPETGRAYRPEDLDYPLGGARWIGLKGIEGDAVGRSGFAIHGIGETQDFKTHQSRGVIVMKNRDIPLLYDMLVPELSTVEVLD